jgi:hypothetical protein
VVSIRSRKAPALLNHRRLARTALKEEIASLIGLDTLCPTLPSPNPTRKIRDEDLIVESSIFGEGIKNMEK